MWVTIELDKLFEVKNIDNRSLFLWRDSETSLAIMRIEDLNNSSPISDIWEMEDIPLNKITQMSIILSPKPEKAILLGKLETSSLGYFIKAYDMTKRKMRTFRLEAYKKELGLDYEESFEVISIEKTNRTNKFIMSVAINNAENQSKIIEVKISKDGLSAFSSLKFDSQIFKKMGKLLSYNINNSDYILCHGMNNLMVIRNDDKNLQILSVFNDIVAGNVLDSFVFKNKIFAVTPDVNKIMEILCPEDDKNISKMMNKVNMNIHFEKFIVEKFSTPSSRHS